MKKLYKFNIINEIMLEKCDEIHEYFQNCTNMQKF